MKNRHALFALSMLVLLPGCVHLQKDKPLPPEGESAVRTTEEEGETNLETPSVEPAEAQTDADVQVKF